MLQRQASGAKPAVRGAEALAVAVVGLHAVLAVCRAGSAPAGLSAALTKSVATDAGGLGILAAFVLVRVGVREAACGLFIDAFRQPVRKQRR